MTPTHILILYDPYSTYVSTTLEYLESFRRYSKYTVHYLSASGQVPCLVNFDNYDVIISHYSIRLSFDWHLSKSVAEKFANFKGLKLAFVQDEYDHTKMIWHHIKMLGINVLFTCVPEGSINKVYPKRRFPNTTFISILTGYVPLAYQQLEKYSTPLNQRATLIGYRGRKLPFQYGDLAREKYLIGLQVKEYCQDKPYQLDIAWDEQDRIYGDNWYKFLGSCRATLGTESGSNVFDFDGQTAQKIKDEINRDPDVDYHTVHKKYLRYRDGKIKMNQISPKIFESIVLRTALVLFEGKYSGVIEADKHYIPLKRDLSNIEDVFAKLQDISYLESLTQRAFNDVILSGNYFYEKFIALIDNVIAENFTPRVRETHQSDDFTYYLTGNLTSFNHDAGATLFQAFSSNKPVSQQELAKVSQLNIINRAPTMVLPDSLLGRTLSKEYHVLQKIVVVGVKVLPVCVINLIKKILSPRYYRKIRSINPTVSDDLLLKRIRDKWHWIMQRLRTIIAAALPRSVKNLLKRTLFRRRYVEMLPISTSLKLLIKGYGVKLHWIMQKLQTMFATILPRSIKDLLKKRPVILS